MNETLRTALSGLGANKLRSGLTILGLMIGVGSVIVLIAVGTGSSSAVESEIDALGSNTLTITPSTSIGGVGSTGATSELTVADADALKSKLKAPDIQSVAPVVDASDVEIAYDNSTYEPDTFVGTTPGYQAARDYTMSEGKWFTNRQVKNGSNVLVIGPTVAEELFGAGDPVGESVEIDNTSFEIVGVTASKGSNESTDLDDVAMAPITSVEALLTGYGSVDDILIQAASKDAVSAAETEATDILKVVDPETAGSDDENFEITDQSSVLSASDSSSKVFTTLLAEVAAISLLVGGIGVMNIMLVSVTERTREIGIRKAVGARRADVLKQFLLEAVLVSVFGGIAGVIAGVVGSQFKIAGIVPVIAPYSIVLAFGASVLIGLFFGTYPAARAAAMRPIDALRFE